MRTKDVRPWWWWVNPWLYIKRRDKAYDDALDTLRELCLDVEYPERKITNRNYLGPFVLPSSMTGIIGRCKGCGRNYIIGIVEEKVQCGTSSVQESRE